MIKTLVLALMLAAFMAIPAQAMTFGIEDDNVLLYHYYGNPDEIINNGKDLNATVIRGIVVWNRVEIAPGQFDWTGVDDFVARARSNGFRVYLTLGGTPLDPPEWQGTAAKPRLAGFYRFASEAAKRYRGQVADFGLYNEPDWSKVAPTYYRRIYLAGRHAIKAQAPHAHVYFGELTGANPIGYTTAALRGGHIRTEGFAWHPYQFQIAPEKALGRTRNSLGIGRLGVLRRFLRSHRRVFSTSGRKTVGMYATEFGYQTRGDLSITDNQAAAWWPRAIKQGRRGGLKLLIAYQVAADNRVMPWDSSLLDPSGTPRPAFLAIKEARHG